MQKFELKRANGCSSSEPSHQEYHELHDQVSVCSSVSGAAKLVKRLKNINKILGGGVFRRGKAAFSSIKVVQPGVKGPTSHLKVDVGLRKVER